MIQTNKGSFDAQATGIMAYFVGPVRGNPTTLVGGIILGGLRKKDF